MRALQTRNVPLHTRVVRLLTRLVLVEGQLCEEVVSDTKDADSSSNAGNRAKARRNTSLEPAVALESNQAGNDGAANEVAEDDGVVCILLGQIEEAGLFLVLARSSGGGTSAVLGLNVAARGLSFRLDLLLGEGGRNSVDVRSVDVNQSFFRDGFFVDDFGDGRGGSVCGCVSSCLVV